MAPIMFGWFSLPWYILLLASGITGWLFQEASRGLAWTYDLLDYPNSRKIHTRPVPLSGGPGIFAPLLILYLVWLLGGAPGMSITAALGIGLAFTVTFATGLLDDMHGIRAGKRLAVQAAVATLLWTVGFRLDVISFGSWTLEFGIFSLPLTVFWFMGFMNTSNLMDGMDGLSGGMNLIALISLGVFGSMVGLLVGSLALGLATATVVYLLFNLSSDKKVFLGDSGSVSLGLSVAWLALIMAGKTGTGALNPIPLGLALAAYSVGILDVLNSIIRRRRSGHSPFKADRHHFHHKLLRAGLGRFWTLATMHGLAALTVYAIALPLYGSPLAVLHFMLPLALVLGAGIKLLRINLTRDTVVLPLEQEGIASSSLNDGPQDLNYPGSMDQSKKQKASSKA